MIAPSSIVTVTRGNPITTSVVVAEKFGKRHADVLRAIENLDCSDGFRQRNFALTSHEVIQPNGGTRELPAFEITRDGFSFLAMGFTGKEAAVWKEKFIAAFNLLASEINRLHQMHASPDWQQARIEGKGARHGETDTIKAFVGYAQSQGSRSANMYYLCLTKETNRALFYVDAAVGKDFRDKLTPAQLASLAMAEKIVERALLEAMTAGTYYKNAYRVAAERVRQFAALIGQSVPGRAPALLGAAQ